jgi:hypothetical protein
LANQLGTFDCFIDVCDHLVTLAPDLVAKSAEASEAAASHGTLHGHPSGRALPSRDRPRVLDHEASGDRYLEGRVVEVEGSRRSAARLDELVDRSVEPNEASTRAEWEPEERTMAESIADARAS